MSSIGSIFRELRGRLLRGPSYRNKYRGIGILAGSCDSLWKYTEVHNAIKF